jgi:hypothetical protein
MPTSSVSGLFDEENILDPGDDSPRLDLVKRISIGAGAQPIYRRSFADAARKYSLLGASNIRLAELFGVTPEAFEMWMNEHPEFADAVVGARDRADAEIASSMYRRAKGYDIETVRTERKTVTQVHVPADTMIGERWLRLRRHWVYPDERGLTISDILTIADAARAEASRRGLDRQDIEAAGRHTIEAHADR